MPRKLTPQSTCRMDVDIINYASRIGGKEERSAAFVLRRWVMLGKKTEEEQRSKAKGKG